MSCPRCGNLSTPCTALGYCNSCEQAWDSEVKAYWAKQERDRLEARVAKKQQPREARQ